MKNEPNKTGIGMASERSGRKGQRSEEMRDSRSESSSHSCHDPWPLPQSHEGGGAVL